MTQSIDNIIGALQSSDFEEQLLALDSAKDTVAQLLRESVRSLFDTDARYVIAERLWKFGNQVIPELEAQLLAGGDPEAVVYAALVLLRLGSRAGLPHLMEAIRNGIGPVGMIAES